MGGQAMKEKGKMWIAKAAVVIFLMGTLVRLVAGSESVWSVLPAVLYFGVICSGYRWGISGGALGGILCGLAEWIRGGEPVALGLMCVMGVLAGCFRKLGRGGSLLAFLCGAVGLGLWYGQEYLLSLLPDLLTAAALFVLMPVDAMLSLTGKPEGKQDVPGNWEEMQRQRLQETAQTYGKLAQTCDTFHERDRSEEGADSWKDRFLESREAVSLQFREMEKTLKEMAAQLDQAADVTAVYEKSIRESLRRRRLQCKRLLVLDDGSRREAYVTVSSGRSGCVTAREVSESVGKTMDRRLRPAEGGRTVVGKEPCTLRLVEDTNFRLLFGMARQCKEEEDLSGDNFSCHELPDGRIMLCLSDGMGSGTQAFLESQMVTELLEELLEAGFSVERAIYMVNALLLVQEEQNPTTMDLALVDLYTGRARFYKQGAVGTFIRRGDQVLQVEPGALPMGVDCEAAPACARVQLQEGDMIVMLTDGVLDALPGEDKETVLCDYLSHTKKNNARELAEDVLQMARACQEGGARDDMTVMVAGFWKK